MASFQFMVNSRRAIFYTFLTLYMFEVLGASFIEISLVITLPMLISSTMQALVWGRVSDRIRRRRLLIVVGEVFAGVGYLLMWTTISVWVIILGLALIEAVWSMSNTGWAALFADLTEPQERSTLNGRINGLGVIGRIVGITAIGAIYDLPTPGAGFPFVFPIAAAIMFGSVLVLVALVPEAEVVPRIRVEKERLSISRRLRGLFKDYPPGFLVFLGCWAFLAIGWVCYMSLFTVYLRIGLHLTSVEISLVRNLNSGVGLIAAPVAGYLGDRLGRKFVILEALIIQAAVTTLYPFSTALLPMLVVNTLAGITRPAIHTVGYALAADHIPEDQRGRLFGAYNAAWTLSFGLSPTVVGSFYATFRENAYLAGGFSSDFAELQAIVDVFLLSTGLVASGAILFAAAVREPERKRTAEQPEQS
jgi:MFS family permease